MSATKWIEVICDYCDAAIGHYMSHEQARRNILEEGGIIKGKKHYCSDDCYSKYLERIR